MLVIALRILAMHGEGGNPIFGDQRRGHVVLSRQRVGCAEPDVRTTLFKRDRQVRRFRCHVQARSDTLPNEGTFRRKALSNETEDRHLSGSPLDPYDALRRQGKIGYIILDGGNSHESSLRFECRMRDMKDGKQNLLYRLIIQTRYQAIKDNVWLFSRIQP